MKIKQLITLLKDLDESYTEDYRKVMGDPEITIDLFKNNGISFDYAGFSHEIQLTKSDDGVYNILSAFSSDYQKLMEVTPEVTKEDIIKKYPILIHWCPPLRSCSICDRNKQNEKHWFWLKEE